MFATGAVLGTIAVMLAAFIPRAPDLVMPEGHAEIDPRIARRVVRAAAAAMLCCGFGFGAAQTFVPVMMERFELGRVAAFFIPWSLSAVSVRIFAGSASDRWGRRAILVPAITMMTAAVAMLAFVRWLPGIVGAGMLFGSAQGLLYPTMSALVADWSRPENIGRTQSLFSGSFSLGISSCSFFFGTIIERYGYTEMFLVATAICALGLVVFLAGTRHTQPEEAVA